MVFDESCYLSGNSYHSWKIQLQGHKRVSMYSNINVTDEFLQDLGDSQGFQGSCCLNDLVEGDYINDFDFSQNLPG
jgi:hypothetical protein